MTRIDIFVMRMPDSIVCSSRPIAKVVLCCAVTLDTSPVWRAEGNRLLSPEINEAPKVTERCQKVDASVVVKSCDVSTKLTEIHIPLTWTGGHHTCDIDAFMLLRRLWASNLFFSTKIKVATIKSSMCMPWGDTRRYGS